MEILFFPSDKRLLFLEAVSWCCKLALQVNLWSKAISMSTSNICKRIKSPWNTFEDVWWVGREILLYLLVLQTVGEISASLKFCFFLLKYLSLSSKTHLESNAHLLQVSVNELGGTTFKKICLFSKVMDESISWCQICAASVFRTVRRDMEIFGQFTPGKEII